MRPIPRRLLIHEVSIKGVIGKDSWGKPQFSKQADLSFVRVEPSIKVVRDKNNQEIQLAATLFYDCINSRPKNMEFRADQIVAFSGEAHRIVTIELLYDERKLHHYEIGMVRYAEGLCKD